LITELRTFLLSSKTRCVRSTRFYRPDWPGLVYRCHPWPSIIERQFMSWLIPWTWSHNPVAMDLRGSQYFSKTRVPLHTRAKPFLESTVYYPGEK
jgi:hypothetical protein